MQTKLELGLKDNQILSRRDYIEAFRVTARRLLKKQATITTDDVRRVCPVPKGMNPKAVGAAIQHPDFVPIGWTRTTRRVAHGRAIQRFRLRDIGEK
jgi:hypothetical protein